MSIANPLIRNLDEMADYIELLRTELLEKSQQLGINHEATILASQELDGYILQYQRLTEKGL
ncbi:aspartyl-phosphate phosphatase Spo0E family protein [Bacillus sp. FJAT-27245]|uniref:aspartyl-phosphate phosphatase Spo0E family protein n=1 Tax=Bacillus sp. FJAT-27245 TaxID=1684144 RepID=UPI0012E0E92A|nr:aspartyl-phosphate phosphatase Spo0E family protein [Bacillus sp. FJAT-27245]